MNLHLEKTTKLYCNSCLRETSHDVLASREHEWEQDPEYPSIQAVDTYQMVQCRGCDSISFCFREFCSEAVGLGDPGERITKYPPAMIRRHPRWAGNLPRPFDALLREVYTACITGAPTLAAMGIRAIIDGVATNKVGDQGNFSTKVEALVAGEFISSYQKEILDAAFDAGSAAMHRAYCPSSKTLEDLLDIGTPPTGNFRSP